MRFPTFRFALFAAVLLLVYYRLPGKWQWTALLAGSWCFCLAGGASNLFFLLFTTLTAWLTAVAMDKASTALGRKAAKPKNKPLLILCLFLNFGMLALCKLRLSALPLGISFFTFQSMGYVIDVYRGTVRAEKSPLRLALFTGYFAQLVQGPIHKYRDLAPQLFTPHSYDRKSISFGSQRMLWGYFKKLVIADRLAVAVIALKAPEFTGISFLILTIFYAVQIYADFTGGIDIALGLSQALGITLSENFRHPFFSRNIAEYWRRWHITLGIWMKDYIFYPISVSAPLRRLSKTARAKFGNFGKRLPVYIASFATWFVTGIWHGVTPNFLLWGMLNCLIIVLSEEFSPLYQKFHARFPLKEKRWYSAFEMLRTFLLMNLIRACDLFPHITDYFRRLFFLFSAPNLQIFRDGTLLNLGLTPLDYAIILAGSTLMFTVSLTQIHRGSIREQLWAKPALRCILGFGLFLAILLLGRYGVGYDASSFIYNQF